MFVDASALLAVLLGEEDGPALLKAMEATRGKLLISPIVRLEATLGLVRRRVEHRGRGPANEADFAAASTLIDGLVSAIEAREMHITTTMGQEAIRALSIYGKACGHPAKLNLGDALSYACARAYHVPLLYKGNDFAQTDIR